MHLLAKDYCVPPPASLAAPLVAVRRAMMPFYSEYNLSSPSLVRTLQAHDNAGRELARIRESLLDALYWAIPSISDAAERHVLLQVKRDIFQKRSVHIDSVALRNEPIVKMLESYERALGCKVQRTRRKS